MNFILHALLWACVGLNAEYVFSFATLNIDLLHKATLVTGRGGP
jgi:hypothetical protein